MTVVIYTDCKIDMDQGVDHHHELYLLKIITMTLIIKLWSYVMKHIKIFFLAIILILPVQTTFANDNSAPYQAKDGKVDPATFVGWGVFHEACVSCHGVGGEGTAVGANLTGIANRLSLEQFRLRVLHKKVMRFTADDWRTMEQALFEEIVRQQKRDQGELANMPRWEYNPMVKEQVENLYRYLKARADGAIGPGKPGVLKD